MYGKLMSCHCGVSILGQWRTLPVHNTNNKAAVLAHPHRRSSTVRKVDLTSGDYTVSTIAGSLNNYGFSDGKAYSPALSTGTPHCTSTPGLVERMGAAPAPASIPSPTLEAALISACNTPPT
jgi:hypothetical protein